MLSKQEFLDKLKSALSERNVSDIDAAPYIDRFDRFYDRMAEDTQETAAVLEDIDTIADNILNQISESYDDINRLTVKQSSADISVNDDMADEEKPTAQIDVTTISDMENYVSEDDPTSLSLLDENSMPLISEEYSALQESSTRLPDFEEEENIPSTKNFWVLFGVSSIIWIPLCLLGLSLFAALWVGLALLTAGSIASIIAVVAVGSAISLVGVIYGIVQLFTSLPTGLYEIGLGVITAGVVMLLGILLYNFAIRLVPILFKQVLKLFKFTLKKVKLLFNYFRKECAKI